MYARNLEDSGGKLIVHYHRITESECFELKETLSSSCSKSPATVRDTFHRTVHYHPSMSWEMVQMESIFISRCYLLSWNNRTMKNNFNYNSLFLNLFQFKEDPWWKEYPSLLFTTVVKPQEQKKICNFLELQVMVWEDKVSRIRNYLYVASSICFHNIWWESLHHSWSCSISPTLGNLSDAWSSVQCREISQR